MAQWVRRIKLGEVQRQQIEAAQAAAELFLQRKSGENPFALREELGKLVWESVGIIRTGDDLQKAIEQIQKLGKRLEQVAVPGGRSFNLAWQQAIDMRNLLLASELIARSALLREESRGAHFREDFQQTDNVHWLQNIYLTISGAGVKSWTEAVKLGRLRP